MQHNHYSDLAVTLLADLANNPPTSVSDLVRRCEEGGFVAAPTHRADLPSVRVFIDEWARIAETADPQERSRLLNAMMAEAATYPRLTNHDGHWHLHHRDDGVTLAHALKAWGSVGTAAHLVARGMTALGRCEADDCTLIFADTSRAGTRRFCSPACANRSAVRRHRARHRTTLNRSPTP
jgi:predicted RNA-binding Zn ribbon-like protein